MTLLRRSIKGKKKKKIKYFKKIHKCFYSLNHLHDSCQGKEVASHFNQAGHTIDDVAVSGILYQPMISQRHIKEARLIRNISTLVPLGMNHEDSCSRKLMRTALKHFSDQMNSSHLGMTSSRDALHDKVNSRMFSSIRGLIHRLNSRLYENLI